MKLLLILLLAMVSCSSPKTTFTADDFKKMGKPTHVVIPNGTTHIDDKAFWYAVNLESVEIPQSVTHIGDRVFVYCSKLTEITIPASVVHIGDGAFGRSELTKITLEGDNFVVVDDILYNKEMTHAIRNQDVMREDFVLAPTTTHIGAYLFDASYSLRSVVIPPSVTHIGEAAFNRAQNLHTAQIPSGVTHIEADAFSTCSRLTELTIPASVEYIGGGAFSRCNKLELTVENDRYVVEDRLLLNADKSRLISSLDDNRKTIDLPPTVTYIDASAYIFSPQINAVRLEAPVEHIGYRAFFGCRNLRRVWMAESVNYIDESAFNYNISLVTIHLSDNITFIGEYAFGNCDKFTELTLPKSLEHIGDKAFMNCRSLFKIEIPASTTFIGERVFEGCDALGEIFVQSDSPLLKQLKEEYGDKVKEI